MANRLTNTDGSRIGLLQFDMSDGEISGTVVLRVLPNTGYRLQADDDDDLILEARENGSGDPWTDLSTGIDLSSYPENVPVDFDLRCTAGNPLTDIRRVALHIAVVSQGAAAWS
jgi:hypothetical protein